MRITFARSSMILLLLSGVLSACDGNEELAAAYQVAVSEGGNASFPDGASGAGGAGGVIESSAGIPAGEESVAPPTVIVPPEQVVEVPVTEGTDESEDETEIVDTPEVVDTPEEVVVPEEPEPEPEPSILDIGELHNYANQPVPSYIQKDNTTNNVITDAGATLGRVLFYDTQLSTDNSVSCASCHQQSAGFSDPSVVSAGVNGQTGRHSMRLINSRFADEDEFFWDERAATLEIQTTQPIRDHAEMGFSGDNNAPEFSDLIVKLSAIAYYEVLFVEAYGNPVITEQGIQDALAQFIRSIQSFDTKYDRGRVLVNNDRVVFPNFTVQENDGKRLFMDRLELDGNTGQRVAGTGLGCQTCHRAPDFDIDPNTQNNGVISVAGSGALTDTTVTRSPTLRDAISASGVENGPFMHDGSLADFNAVLDHYNEIVADRNANNNLDRRLTVGRQAAQVGQQLMITDAERSAVIAFMKTLGGSSVYTDERWSDPFNESGELILNSESGE